MDTIDTRLYLFTGFLESGKTRFINDTVLNTNFCDNERSVLIVTERGEIEYNQEELEAHETDLVYVDNKEDLNSDLFLSIKEKYNPTQVLLELNGMWDVDPVLEIPLPDNWAFVQILTTINAQTFQLYVNNMRSLLYQHCSKSDLIIFNRIPEGMKKSGMRNNVKAMNPRAQVIYENEDGTIDRKEDEELPYDYSGDYLEVQDHDFGIFCYDTVEHPERYANKRLRLKGKFIGKDRYIPNAFILGRYAMVCCEQDTSLIGMLCISELADQFIPDEWLIVEGQTFLQYDEEYGGNLCLLHVDKIEGTKPLDYEYVTFD